MDRVKEQAIHRISLMRHAVIRHPTKSNGNDATPATWSSASLNVRKEAYHKMSLTWLLINGKSGHVRVRRWKNITLNIC